jgi:hypothetical protein
MHTWQKPQITKKIIEKEVITTSNKAKKVVAPVSKTAPVASKKNDGKKSSWNKG